MADSEGAPATTTRSFDFAIVALGVCAVSTAAPLIREAAAPSLVIAASRLAPASLPLLALSAVRGVTGHAAPAGYKGGETRRTLLTLAAGAFLALHFGFWVASVKQTSIVTSVVLVTAQPLFVGLAGGPLLGERPSRATWLGIALATLGAAVMVANDAGRGSHTLVGDLYAVLGAIFAAGYLLAGRSLLSAGDAWLSYSTRAYSVAAVLLVAAALLAGESFRGYSAATYGWLVLLALVPQLIGHTALNFSLGRLSAATVAVAILGEPVGSTLLGAIFLSETPTALQLSGAALVLAGVYAGLRDSFSPSDVAPETL